MQVMRDKLGLIWFKKPFSIPNLEWEPLQYRGSKYLLCQECRWMVEAGCNLAADVGPICVDKRWQYNMIFFLPGSGVGLHKVVCDL
jgi:hypothetical protein